MSKKFIFLSKEEFITRHLETCTAKPCKKYDNDKNATALHSLDYSRRKCAKNAYKKYIQTKGYKQYLQKFFQSNGKQKENEMICGDTTTHCMTDA